MTPVTEVSLADPGRDLETSRARVARRQAGMYFTPPDVAQGLVAITIASSPPSGGPGPTVCDPTCGAGAFLVAAADRLAEHGQPVATIVEDLLWGADVDPEAVGVAREVLRRWAAERGVTAEPRHLVIADTLVAGAAAWPDRPEVGFDYVIGNPPFQSQLATDTARDAERAAAVRESLGALAAPYADSAALFLVVACRMARADGRVAMIVPESVLSNRDAGPTRAELLSTATLVGLWWAGEPIFDAGVQVCAPVLAIGQRNRPTVPRWRGRRFEPAGTAPHPDSSIGSARRSERPWSPLLASLRGTPAASVSSPAGERPAAATLEALATTTAGFRDQYYGLIPHVSDLGPEAVRRRLDADADGDPAGAGDTSGEIRLVTAGLIDPLRSRWGRTPTRFAGQPWTAPVIDRSGLRQADPKLATWADARLVPKLIVATQTRLIETVVDLDGTWWPSVPTIAVVPGSGDPDDLWRIAAVLSAPPVSAWALERFGGSALSSDAVKLSARQVLSVPLPTDEEAWAEGAAAAHATHQAGARGDAEAWSAALDTLGVAMTRAYGASDEVHQWWRSRLPGWR